MLLRPSPNTKLLSARTVIKRYLQTTNHAQYQEFKPRGLVVPLTMVSILSLGTLGLMKATLATDYQQPDIGEDS